MTIIVILVEKISVIRHTILIGRGNNDIKWGSLENILAEKWHLRKAWKKMIMLLGTRVFICLMAVYSAMRYN